MIRDRLTVTRWHTSFRGRRVPHALGRGGVSDHKVEGDGATPAGTLTITGALYRADRMARPVPWAKAIGPRDLWCDDPAHPAYNLMVRGPIAARREALRRGDRLYDLILTTDWNWPEATPRGGSAIFIHRWRAPRQPTAGCLAYGWFDLVRIARQAPPGTVIEIRG